MLIFYFLLSADAMSYLVDIILQLTCDGQKPQDHISIHQDQDYLNAVQETRTQATFLPRRDKKEESKCCPF